MFLRDSIDLMDSLFSYRKQLHAMETDLNATHLIDSMFVNPYVRKSDVARICNIHPSTAGKLVNGFVERGSLSRPQARRGIRCSSARG